MKCYYLVGYHGCGKTTQANKLEAEHPIFNFIGGKPGLDAIPNVQTLMKEVRSSKTDMFIHGCIFQTEPMLKRLSLATELHIIVMHTFPKEVEARTLARGANSYNIQKYKIHHSFIRKLKMWIDEYNFQVHIIDNNQSVDDVYKQIKKICVRS